jgi:hypothetical protein
MKKVLNLKMEKLSNTDSLKLVGGFSVVFFDSQQDTTIKTNNCSGGNIKAGCGKKKSNKKITTPGTNANCHGNCVKGCGDKK